jgi:hypothetical protein
MAWVDRFLPVLSTTLELDEPVMSTDKATEAQLASYARNVTEIYRKLAAGLTPEELEGMRLTGASPQERELGETFHQLFSEGGRDGRIEAEYVDGHLIVQRGRHRVLAAQEGGVPVLPVHVLAHDETTMSALSARIEREVAESSPEALAQHRALGRKHDAPFGAASPEFDRDDHRGDDVSFGVEGTSRKNGPEFEPQPSRAGTTGPVPEAQDIQRELGRRALADQPTAATDARKARLERALGSSAVDASRTPDKDRSRERS